MVDEGTEPIRSTGLAIRAVRIEVVSGPDAGKMFVAQSDSVTVGTAEGNDLVLTDPTISRFHLELRRHRDRILVVDHGSTNGTLIGPARLDSGSAAVRAGTTLKIGETSIKVDDGQVVMLDEAPDSLGGLRGQSPAIRRMMATVGRVAQTDVPVLVLGESGTGKELIARALHDASARADRPFVTVDCAAITPTLFSSELFGHERGAFTGAERRHIGAFERGNGGTVFLDEIGELPSEIQSALLGVLERRRLQRVGGREEIEVDVRLVSATHRDLRARVNAGDFRLDLFYRIAVVLLSVPPLRERPDDIALLVEHFLREAGFDGPVADVFDADALEQLRKHQWPGNVRELRNVVLGTLALGDPLEMPPPAASNEGDVIAPVLDQSYKDAKRTVLDEFERRYLTRLLERTGGNIRQAARDAKMDRSYLMELLRRHRMR